MALSTHSYAIAIHSLGLDERLLKSFSSLLVMRALCTDTRLSGDGSAIGRGLRGFLLSGELLKTASHLRTACIIYTYA